MHRPHKHRLRLTGGARDENGVLAGRSTFLQAARNHALFSPPDGSMLARAFL